MRSSIPRMPNRGCHGRPAFGWGAVGFVLIGHWCHLPPWKLAAGKLLESFHILLSSLIDDVAGEHRGRAILVPARCYEPVAHKLLVERWLPPAWSVLICGPESRAVGRQHLVDEDQFVIEPPPLEFCVRDDY